MALIIWVLWASEVSLSFFVGVPICYFVVFFFFSIPSVFLMKTKVKVAKLYSSYV